jgi:hypothetical protein
VTKSICSKRSIKMFLLLLLSGMSQAEPIWLMVDEAANESELSSAVKPNDAITPLAIEITLATLATLDRDSEVVLSIGGGVELSFVIENVTHYPNGDIGWSAAEESNGYLQTFSITAGATDLVASLMTDDKSYEVVAKRQAHRDSYIGWLYREAYKTPKPLSEKSVASRVSDRAFFLEKPEPGLSVVISTDLVDRYYTIIGQSLVWTFTLSNTLDRVTTALTLSLGGNYVDAAYKFEDAGFNDNSEFFDLPDNCVEKAYLDTDPFRMIDEILCEIDPIASQSSQTLTLKSRTKPGVTLDQLVYGEGLSFPSATLLETETYVTAYGSYNGHYAGPIPIVDVLTDSDADGLSDYNEGLLGSDPLDASSDATRDVMIDIAVLYTSNFVEQVAINAETKINSAMTIVNEMFSGSKTGIQFNIVHYEPLDYINNCIADRCEVGQSWNDTQTVVAEYGVRNKKEWRFSEKIRSLKGADYVLIMDGGGGLDPTGGQAEGGGFNRGYFGFQKHKRTAFVHYENLDYDTDEVVIAHELSHLLGNSHSRKQNRDSGLPAGMVGTFPWAAGHAVDNKFVTIMPYATAFGIASQINRFSDASRSDCNYTDPITMIEVFNAPCGIEIADTENGADVVAAMRIVRYQHEMFSPPRPVLPTRASDGENYSSKFLASAIKDIEVGFVSNFLSSEKINIEGTIRISPEHAGKIGTTHIILDAGALGAFQLNDSNAFVPLDLTAPVLVGAIEPRPLKSIEDLLVFDDLVPRLLGIDSLLLNIYFGYSLLDTGLLVYSGAPLTVQIGQP